MRQFVPPTSQKMSPYLLRGQTGGEIHLFIWPIVVVFGVGVVGIGYLVGLLDFLRCFKVSGWGD